MEETIPLRSEVRAGTTRATPSPSTRRFSTTTLVDEASDDVPPEVGVFLNQLLNQLGELDRALILLYLEGHDHETIADILGLTHTNVATKIGRIKQKRDIAVRYWARAVLA